ncbi:MAG TPA: ABC transporter ATP-binding protein [Polyangiaceae bacterium]|nr:ABC transporter ATP-binding protein [Polyangiaceae bacterium]
MAGALTARFTKERGSLSVTSNLTIPVDRYQVTVLFGASGSGKTTILRCIAGLDDPEFGTIRFGEEIWFERGNRSLSPQRRCIGYVAQDYALFPHLTVAENVGFGLRDIGRRERAASVKGMLDALELGAHAEKRPRALSGGEMQRVSLARAVVRKPRLLLLDEPLSALDAPTRERVRAELGRYLARFAIPTLIVTHDRMEALALGERMVVLVGGEVRQSGEVAEVFRRPCDAEVAHLLGVESVVGGEVEPES